MELGPFCRELVKWAFAHYKQASSLFILKQAKVTTPHHPRRRDARLPTWAGILLGGEQHAR